MEITWDYRLHPSADLIQKMDEHGLFVDHEKAVKNGGFPYFWQQKWWPEATFDKHFECKKDVLPCVALDPDRVALALPSWGLNH